MNSTTKQPNGHTERFGTNGTWNLNVATTWASFGRTTQHITKKVTDSTEVRLDDMRRAAAAAANKPTAQLPDSVFLRALGTPEVNQAPPQTGSLALRATEEWERCICENKAFAI